MDAEFRQTSKGDIPELIKFMLPADRVEILALGYAPLWALENSLDTSLESVSIWKDGRLACMAGVSKTNDLDEDTHPWMISTSVVLENPRDTLILSRQVINRWRGMYPHMSNYVDARHHRAIRWLLWLGAAVGSAHPHGPYSRPFHKFTFGEF